MSNIKLLIVEDNPLHQEQLYILLQSQPYDIVGIVSSAEEVLPALLRLQPDVVLLDIDLGESNDGIDIAHKINKLKPTPIIFTTARTDSETIRKAVTELPVSYLVKPIQAENLLPAIELAIFKNENSEHTESLTESTNYQKNSEAVFIKSRGELIKLSFQDLCAIEVEKDRYLKFITNDDEFLVRSSIKEILEKLPNYFIQVYRSIVVNINKLESINEFENTVVINGKDYALSNTYKKDILDKIKII